LITTFGPFQRKTHASIAGNQLKPLGFHALIGGHACKMLMSAMGHKRTNHRRPKPTFVRYYPNSGQTRAQLECPLFAIIRHRTLDLK
jgi:hypothetical protein